MIINKFSLEYSPQITRINTKVMETLAKKNKQTNINLCYETPNHSFISSIERSLLFLINFSEYTPAVN